MAKKDKVEAERKRKRNKKEQKEQRGDEEETGRKIREGRREADRKQIGCRSRQFGMLITRHSDGSCLDRQHAEPRGDLPSSHDPHLPLAPAPTITLPLTPIPCPYPDPLPPPCALNPISILFGSNNDALGETVFWTGMRSRRDREEDDEGREIKWWRRG